MTLHTLAFVCFVSYRQLEIYKGINFVVVAVQERRRQQRIAEITEMIHVASLLHDDVIDNAGELHNCFVLSWHAHLHKFVVMIEVSVLVRVGCAVKCR